MIDTHAPRHGERQGDGRHAGHLVGRVAEVERIRELIVAARDLWETVPGLDEVEQRSMTRLTFRLLHIADIEAVTAGG